MLPVIVLSFWVGMLGFLSVFHSQATDFILQINISAKFDNLRYGNMIK